MAVLDASYLIDLGEGTPEAVDLLASYRHSDEPLLVPAQAAAEFIAGSESPLVAYAHLDNAFELTMVGPNEIMETARLARLSVDRGLRPRWPDLSIGAVAMLHATHVVTANPRDFLRIDVPAFDHRTKKESTGASA